jgi:2,5-furandicarboxylate decarboxylase 1
VAIPTPSSQCRHQRAAAPLDPCTDGGYSSSVGIDATRPYGVEFPEVSEVPGWRDFDLPEINEG